jgi:S-adenosylmethionine/arginine decarboxylase-like enzyme
VGRAARIVLEGNPNNERHRQSWDGCHVGTSSPPSASRFNSCSPAQYDGGYIPGPVSKSGEATRPRTTDHDTASTTCFEAGCSTPGSSSNERHPASFADDEDAITGEGGGEDEDGFEERLPVGKHLLVDLHYVDPEFLNSEERLVDTMLGLVEEFRLTLLSYHCHRLQPVGVACGAVLLESHLFVRTWPLGGVLAMDLFTSGPQSLLPVLPLVEKLFSIASTIGGTKESTPPLRSVWAYKVRGFTDSLGRDDIAMLSDMNFFPVGIMTDFKREVRNRSVFLLLM